MKRRHRIALPLYLDALNHLHHPEFRQSVSPSTQVIVYHGTSSVALSSMLQHGQLSWDDSRKNYTNTSPGVFVTTSPGFFSAEMYGHKSTETQGGDEVVLELQLPLGWIAQDPDDTRVDAAGRMNDLGKTQGMVTKPISVKRIKQLKVHSDALAQVFNPNPNTEPDIMGYWTPWMPIGKFLDKIAKSISKGVTLPFEYSTMVGVRPRGLAKSPAPESREQELAEGLLSLYHTFVEVNYGNDESDYDKTLWFVHKNKLNPWVLASSVVPIYIQTLGGEEALRSYREGYEGTQYWPKAGESLMMFLRRQ